MGHSVDDDELLQLRGWVGGVLGWEAEGEEEAK